MNPYERNPIIRARVANRLQAQKEGQTLEELAKHIGIGEASVREVLEGLAEEGRAKTFAGKWTLTPSALAEFKRLTNMLMEETHRPWLARKVS